MRQAVWNVAVAGAIAVALLTTAWKAGIRLLMPFHPSDFAVYWWAVRMPLERVFETLPQGPWDGIMVTGPFAYPPTTLLWLQPLRGLPMVPTFVAFSALSLFAYVWAARRTGADWRAIALSASAPCMFSGLATGQLAVAVAALLIAGLCSPRPWVAGLLFALAATLKPQAVAFIPLGLLAAAQWRTLAWTVGFGTATGIASIAVFGPGLWLDWLAALPRFQETLHGLDFIYKSVTLTAFFSRVGLPEAWGLIGIPLGTALVWVTFSRPSAPLERVAAVSCAYLLASPYAMFYELAALQLFAVSAILHRRPRWRDYPGALLVYGAHFMPYGVALMSAALAARVLRRPAPDLQASPSHA